MAKVFIDGSAGTTGLQIYERLQRRGDIALLTLSDDKRKVAQYRKEMINKADIAFLCLPDAAAKEAVAMAENPDTIIIDTSTAHRTSGGWTYGFAEISGQRQKIKNSKRIANPGCHASGFIALIAPLTEMGILDKNSALSCFSLTGYSGGGKSMIAAYEGTNDKLLGAPRAYALGQQHKHLPEMVKYSGLETAPVFCPVVAPFYSGMEVIVPLFKKDILSTMADIKDTYKNYYTNGLVHFCENNGEGGFMSAAAYSQRDDMQISVCGNDERILLISRFDNLGKGASGAAVQNMNIALGIDEFTSLAIRRTHEDN